MDFRILGAVISLSFIMGFLGGIITILAVLFIPIIQKNKKLKNKLVEASDAFFQYPGGDLSKFN